MDTVLTLLLLGLVTLITVFFRRYSKNELSGLGCAFGSLIVTGLVFLLLIFMGIRGCSEQSEKEAEYWKDKTECDCIRAYTKDKLSIYDLMIPEECGGLFGLSSYHPCQDIVGLSINNIYNQDSTNIEFDYKEEFLKEYFQDTITTFNCHFQ